MPTTKPEWPSSWPLYGIFCKTRIFLTARSVSEICEVVEHFVPHATTWVHSYGSLTTVEVSGVFFAFVPAYRRRIERRITDALRARGTVGTEWKVVVR